ALQRLVHITSKLIQPPQSFRLSPYTTLLPSMDAVHTSLLKKGSAGFQPAASGILPDGGRRRPVPFTANIAFPRIAPVIRRGFPADRQNMHLSSHHSLFSYPRFCT